MSKQLIEQFDSRNVTDDMLREAAKLFNENYGIWGKHPETHSKVPRPGTRVKLSKDRLRDGYLSADASCFYVRVTIDDRLAGNAFACRWSYGTETVCWITQLVVHRDFRERGLAAGLLNHIRKSQDDIYGLMSSHPAACLAASRAYGSGIERIALEFIAGNASSIMQTSPIDYVKKAIPSGSLFDPHDNSGQVSVVKTDFFVDHTEPLEALAEVREHIEWPLGNLLDGFEFLVIVKSRRPRRVGIQG